MTNSKLWVAEKPKLYVGNALTPPDYLQGEALEEFEAFKGDLEAMKQEDKLNEKWQVLRFLGLTAGTSSKVYLQDIGNVNACNAFLAVADYPSTGLGMELEHAVRENKPTLIAADTRTRLSRMVIGPAELFPNIDIARYEDRCELPSIVNNHFTQLLTRP